MGAALLWGAVMAGSQIARNARKSRNEQSVRSRAPRKTWNDRRSQHPQPKSAGTNGTPFSRFRRKAAEPSRQMARPAARKSA